MTNEAAEYTFDLRGEDRPVGVLVPDADAINSSQPTLVMVLHPPQATWESSIGLAEFLGAWLRPSGAYIAVAPQSSPAQRGWTIDETFNIEYLTALFAVLAQSFCLDDAEIIVGARGEATVALAQAICSTDLPIDLAYFQLGMVTVDDCSPPRPVPILSIGRFGAEPAVGPHWDGTWSSPSATEGELTGGFGSDPDEIAEWADVYGCSDESVVETLPDSFDVLVHDTVVLSHDSCATPIVAFGMQPDSATYGVHQIALETAADRIFASYELLLGR